MVTSRDQAVEILRTKREHLRAEFGVVRIGLFGSFASETHSDESDIDLIVELEHPLGFRFVELADYLQDLLGRKVELLTPAGIQAIRATEVARNIQQSTVYV